MGLDERVEQNDFASDPALQGWWGNKIDPEKAWQITKNTKREPLLQFTAGIDTEDPAHSRAPQKYANMRAKNLLRVAQKVYRTRNAENLAAYRRQILRDSKRFSPEDIDLCTLAMDVFTESRQFPQFIEGLKPGTIRSMFLDDDIGKIMQQFNDDSKPSLTYDSTEYRFARAVMHWTAYALRNDPDAGRHFPKFARLLNQLSREMNYGLRFNVEQDVIADELIGGKVGIYTSTDSAPLPTALTAKLNNSPRNLVYNNTDCCISGPFGKHRTTALLYWLDPAVHTWEFYAETDAKEDSKDILDVTLPFGLALFFEARGRHHAAAEDTNYLVFEGFPAHGSTYAHIDFLTHPRNVDGVTGPKEPPTYAYNCPSLPQFIYTLGLITAQAKGIPKLIINTSHSTHTQHSVSDTIDKIMGTTHNGEHWDSGAQRLRRDPLSPDGAFGRFTVGASNKGYAVKAQTFEYTHFLAKPAFPADIGAEIRHRDEDTERIYWRDELLLDTHYEWTKFVGNTYDNWTNEARDAHPYAFRVANRANVWRTHEIPPESYWNAGIGYCHGIEVDVQDELGLLKRGELHLLGRSSRKR